MVKIVGAVILFVFACSIGAQADNASAKANTNNYGVYTGYAGAYSNPYSNYCGAYGCGYDGYSNIAVYETTTIKITKSDFWQNFAGSDVLKEKPTMLVEMADNSLANASLGQIQFFSSGKKGSTALTPPARVVFQSINNGLEADIFVRPRDSWFSGVESTGGKLRVIISSQSGYVASFKLEYNSKVIGTGTLARYQ